MPTHHTATMDPTSRMHAKYRHRPDQDCSTSHTLRLHFKRCSTSFTLEHSRHLHLLWRHLKSTAHCYNSHVLIRLTVCWRQSYSDCMNLWMVGMPPRSSTLPPWVPAV